MTNEYDIMWRWKQKEYQYGQRIFSKIVDLFLVYIVAFIIDFGLKSLQIEIDIKMKYRLYLFIYFIYEMMMYVIFKSTLGKKWFMLNYISKDNENNVNQFVIRIISYLVLVALSFEFRIIIPLILYYLIKSFDRFSGPYWDKKIKIMSTTEVVKVYKYLVTMLLVVIITVFSLSNESLLKDYVNDYGEHGVVGSFFSDVLNVFKNDDFNDDIYGSYITNDFEGIVEQYENEEFINLASAESYNYLGLSYMELDQALEAVEVFEYALTIKDSNKIELEGSIYNNLCWAYNSIGEYETAIEQAKKAIKLGDESAYVYANYGNSLFNLELYEEAIVKYEKAIAAEDYTENFVFTTIAECFYQLEDYKNATFYFEKHKIMEPLNPQSYYDLAWSKALDKEDYKAGLDDINEMVRVAAYSGEAIFAKAEYLFDFDADDVLIEFLHNQDDEALVLENPDLSFLLLSSYYNEGLFNETIELGTRMIKSGNMDLGVWYTMLDVYYTTGDYNNVKNLIKNYQVNNANNVETLLEVAYMYSYNYFYSESGHIYEDIVLHKEDYVISIEQWENALYEWLLTLYDSDDYDRFIDICNEYKDTVVSTNLYHFLGLGYYEIGDYDQALESYYKAIELDPEGNYMYEDIIYLHVFNGDYDLARKYLIEAKVKGLADELFEEINQYILEYVEGNPAELIFKFIEDNYMYYNDSPELRDLKKQLVSLDAITDQQFLDINQKVFGNDYFSFIFNGDEFRAYMEMEETATVSSNWVSDKHLYVKIDFFSPLTDTEFLRVIQEVKSPEDKTLIIDVRSNFGGDLESAMNILDYLIGNQFIGDWDSAFEDPFNYYSDGNLTEFGQIYILTDAESASSSEVITLGIKEYIKDAIIIGETTYGKGVGQVSMNNLKYEYALFVVNAYWNINGINIHDIGIEPDIILQDGTLDDYLNIILTN